MVAKLVPSVLNVDPVKVKKAMKHALFKNGHKPERVDIKGIMRE